MAKIFLSAGHGGFEGSFRDPGVIAGNTTEAVEMIATRDLIVAELRARGVPVTSASDNLSLVGTIDWINSTATSRDVALEIQMNGSSVITTRGASAFFVSGRSDRQRQALRIINFLRRRIPELPSRGVQPDSNAPLGRLAFCRDIVSPSIYLELGFLTNPSDRRLIQTRRREFALGLADGLQSWLREVNGL